MRIILTVHQFLPEYTSGTEILTFNAAKELQRRGHDVVIWAATYAEKSGKAIDEYMYDGLKVYRYNYNLERAAAEFGMNAIEAEYNNREFRRIFADFVDDYKPDLIHFFHLSRLSATPVEVGKGKSIPMVFTATDFWLVCPTCQLILPDDTLCTGPAHSGSNCVRHLIAAFQPPQTYQKVKRLPDHVLNFICKLTTKDWWPHRKYAPLISAITRRIGYLQTVMNYFDKVLVPTKLMNDILVQHGLDQEKVVLQPFGINQSGLCVMPKKNSNVLRLGFIGTICEIKGVHVLLEALKKLPSEMPLEVKIYGSEEQFPEYMERLKTLAGDDKRVQFLGSFPNTEIGTIFSEIDILVIPSMWYENTPLVMHTAQATKTPVIATNLGGMNEIVEHNKNGLLFEMGDADALASQIRRFIDDRHLAERLSANAKQPKTIANYADELEHIYSRCSVKLKSFSLITFNVRGDERGSLIPIENREDIPFDIKRVYYIFNTKKDVVRGKHSHRNLNQVLIAVKGSCKVKVNDKKAEMIFTLDKPDKGLYVSGNVWREMFEFSDDCVLLVLADKKYDEEDYIRDFEQFLKDRP